MTIDGRYKDILFIYFQPQFSANFYIDSGLVKESWSDQTIMFFLLLILFLDLDLLGISTPTNQPL